MPCFFLSNVPLDQVWDSGLLSQLYVDLAEVLGCQPTLDDIEFHRETTQYRIMRPQGDEVECKNVHVFVEWHGRNELDLKKKIARLIHDFLEAHGLGTESDLTFRDSYGGTFFLEGELVPGGPLRPRANPENWRLG